MLEFNALAELVAEINGNKVKQIEVLNDVADETGRIHKLYNGLLKKKYQSDEEAAQDIFQADASHLPYRKLRSRLFHLLVNTSFFIDVNRPRYSENSKAFYNCYRLFAAGILVLNSTNAANAGLHILNKALAQSIRHEFTSLTAEISRVLRYSYGRVTMDSAKLKQCIQINRTYEEKRYWEMRATDIFDELLDSYIHGRLANPKITAPVKSDFLQLRNMAEQINTTQFYYLTYQIGMILFLAENDCKSALETCIKAIDTLTLRPSLPRAKMMSFALNALFCYSQLRIFNTPETLSIIETCNRLTPVGSILWFKVHEVEVQHYLYAGEYDKALDKSKAALSHPKFNALTGINADIWRVYAGYFHLLAQLGALDAGAVASVYGPIDPHFFDYEIRIFRTAKEDMNIPVMMIPIYFGALKGELEALGRSKESLEQYTKRHLLIRKNVRSAAMMRLLFALEEMAYDAKSAQKKIKKNLSAFKSTPIELNEFSSAIEIIPYDHLWQLICRYKKIEIH